MQLLQLLQLLQMDVFDKLSLPLDIVQTIAKHVHELYMIDLFHELKSRPSTIERLALNNSIKGTFQICIGQDVKIMYFRYEPRRVFIYSKSYGCEFAVLDCEIDHDNVLLVDRLYNNGHHVAICDLKGDDFVFLNDQVIGDVLHFLHIEQKFRLDYDYKTDTLGWNAATFNTVCKWAESFLV